MRFELGHCRELKAQLAAEYEQHQAEVAELRQRLEYQRSRAARQSQIITQQKEAGVTLGGKINRVRQLLDAAGERGSHVAISRVLDIVDE